MVSILVNIPGYRISEELYNGSRTLVYRGVRETDSLPVVIKLLKNPYPSFSELLSFRNQYTIAKNLNSPLIVQTYSLEPYQNGYALVMEDFGGISLKEWGVRVRGQSLQEFLEIAIALCNTLDVLYRERIIHKDIKPANILINPETKQVKLIDFSIASLLPRETQTLINPNVLEGTLAYISPEQTGRMNRGIDYRTDFYSLGVTFYELLTGELPFQSNDPMELVHSHIAKMPTALANRFTLSGAEGEDIPQVISDIVMKLMAKNAEDRYQSALGLKFDLENCLHQLQVDGIVNVCGIAQRDVCDRFIIPDKLYGRETEVSTLLQAFERVSIGATEMILVAGFSGIGKTAVVNEVHKPIVRQRGYFIKGKYDQFQRNIPFSAFVQAFRDLMGQLLTESDTKIQQWKNKILVALGEDGQVIIDVIPELEIIIGKQPPTPDLSGTAAQNRFNLLFQKFIQIFTNKEHPLVIFLDDLQWTDSASLQLIELLMGADNQGYLLLVGAYRDHEVSPTHPLILTLDKISQTGSSTNVINLQPLSQLKLNQFVADTLKCVENLAVPLSQLIYRKTQGNPFFTTQFLKALHEDGLIAFNWTVGCWEGDISQINQQTLTSDIVEFMVWQLRRLPESTQQVLKLAACIGNQFDLQTLATVSQLSEIETASSLWRALQSEFILPQSAVYKFYQYSEPEKQFTVSDRNIAQYKFLHDRVQQAAYTLIPQAEKQSTHLKIGRLLLHSFSPQAQQERIFDLVNQFNLAQTEISSYEERKQLAQLNLQAGKKAKLSAAYEAAANYFTIGLNLLSVNSWQNDYKLIYDLHRYTSEAAYLCGHFEQAQTLYKEAVTHAQTSLDKAVIYRVQMTQYQLQGRNKEAIEIQRQSLQLLGWEVPIESELIQASLDIEIAKIKQFLQQHSVESILDLSQMTDKSMAEMLRILQILFYAAWLDGQTTLAFLAVAKIATLSLQYGNSDMSPFGYACYGIIANTLLNDFATAYQFGEMAVQLCEQFDNPDVRGMANFVFAADVHSWSRPIRAADTYYDNAYKYGMEAGNWLTVGFMMMQSGSDRLTYGKNLDELYAIAQIHADFLRHIKSLENLDALMVGVIQPIRNLLGLTTSNLTFDDDNFREADYLQKYRDTPYHLAWLYSVKIRHSYLFNHRIAYPDLIPQLSIIENTIASHAKVPSSVFYVALMHLSLAEIAQDQKEHQFHLQAVIPLEEKLNNWQAACPENILHKCLLVQAEKARINGQTTEAIDLYEQAITTAKIQEYIQEQALANELAAKFYLDWGKEKIATGYMQEAYYCYAKWGAKAKIAHLEQNYPQLLTPILQPANFAITHQETITPTLMRSSANTNSSQSSWLDLPTVMQAALAISQEMELEKLLGTLMQITIANAGAEQGYLILDQQGQWLVVAKANSQQTQRLDISLEEYPEIPQSVIYSVMRSPQMAVWENLSDAVQFAGDRYIITHQPKSVLCTPIHHQGQLIGILYLENNLTVGAFTSDRLQVMQLLTAQAAISLKNAQLYCQLEEYSHTLEQKVEERTQKITEKATQLESTLEKLYSTQAQLIQAEKMSGLGQLVAGIAHEINNPINFIYGNLEPASEYVASLIELNNLYQQLYPQPLPEIAEKIADIELEFISNDLPKLLSSMRIGADRIRQIVLSLRNFSRLDESEIKSVDIHSGIDSTLLILQHRLQSNSKHPEIAVIQKYGQLPLVNCYASALNQVFMNIINNAIDALESSDINRQPTIIIKTEFTESKKVIICIADNGIGMSESVQNKIFNPFFTTKPVGSGTGLGLSTSYSIVVEKHGGKLSCISAPGEGTEFIIEIPV